MKLIVVALLGLVASVNAACPNFCSGHGSCGSSDKCTCYRNWQGNDCSERTCPYTISWSSIATEANSNYYHPYAECGNKGTCDHKTGQCQCLDGFEGKGCRRMSCSEFDNACNGHGTCEVLSNILKEDGAATSKYNALPNVWDADKIQYCKCDPGYAGIGCEKRTCKKGNDPLTEYDSTGTSEKSDKQVISITTSGTLTGHFVLKFTDWRGETWKTWALDVATVSSTAVKEALVGLPNLAIPDVTVDVSGSTTAGLLITVTFTSSHTPGPQNLLEIDYSACTDAGCQPISSGISHSDSVSVSRTAGWGTAENVECSNRGSCDYETGICACFEGYYGESCDMQTIIQ